MGTIIELRQHILSELENEENEGLLNDIQSLIYSSRSDSDYSFSWEATKEFNNAIDEAEQDIRDGNVFAHEEVMAYIKNKYVNGSDMVE